MIWLTADLGVKIGFRYRVLLYQVNLYSRTPIHSDVDMVSDRYNITLHFIQEMGREMHFPTMKKCAMNTNAWRQLISAYYEIPIADSGCNCAQEMLQFS